ncbi:rhodanese-like domain-containing protein [Acidiferrobacter sp.]|uniref:rhodanese-like domain-containing protein n=1 Tax=Acidiferrobacter sp. TaxID=1872107 RepID=UPI002616F3C5|nr:rhodanese-like domain-containing protein [Acidiferrobacter sp.]
MTAFVIAHWYLFLALAVVVGLLIAGPAIEGGPGGQRVTTHEAVQMLNHKSAVVIDVREPQEFTSGHIARAINIPLGQVAARTQELKKYKERPVILCCASGARSARAASALRKAGFTDVRNLSGGLAAWRDANLPVDS